MPRRLRGLAPRDILPPDSRLQNRIKGRGDGVDNELLRTLKAYYYACISFVDNQVGRILQALEETGRLGNALILFTSDHGEFLGDYGCVGKRSMLDAAGVTGKRTP